MENTKLALGKRIKELRVNRNLTQEELAELLGIDQRSVSNIECGNTFPSKTLFKLADALNVSLHDLFDFKHIESSPEEMQKYIVDRVKDLNQNELRMLYRFIQVFD